MVCFGGDGGGGGSIGSIHPYSKLCWKSIYGNHPDSKLCFGVSIGGSQASIKLC